MRFSPRSSEDFIARLGQRDTFLEDLRESFAKSFAYDLFEWPDLSASTEVNFQPLPSAGDDQAEGAGAGGNQIPDGDAVALYTTTASDIPLYMPGQAVPIEGDGGFVPSTSASSPLVAMDEFRVDARFDGIDGSGYTVAVLDSGIDLDDPFFGPDGNGDGISDRIVYQYDFADGDANASDVDGHGSNVASIAASSDGTYTGMAPGADIAALKVFSDSGSGNFGYLESALQWVIDNAEAYNIVSVNMSLGDSGNYNAPVQLYGIADELATLASMDVIVVSASGNSFHSFNSFQGVSYPAADPNSLSVGAVYDGNVGAFSYQSGAIAYSTSADQIAPFSQRDDQLSDIFAPGAPITGAGAGIALETMHGTSQAAPHIAGIVAVAQQLAVQELGRKLTFDEFSQLLSDSGDTIFDGDDEDDNVTNTGLAFQRVNMLALGEAILALAPPEPDPAVFSIVADDAAKPEGDSDTTSYSFIITRSGDTSGSDSVSYSVSGSGAEPGNAADFLGNGLPAGQVTFASGETSKIITIEVIGDTDVEGDEGFTVTLSDPSADAEIAVASANGVIENDDSVAPGEPVVLVDADFDSGGGTSEGFTYIANAFGGDTSANYARGTGTNDIRVVLGGRDSADIVDMSGGWEHSFTLDSEMEVTLSFLYEMILDSDYESDEFSQVLFSLNGGTAQVIATLTGDGNGGPDQTTGQQNFVADLGLLPAGTHSIVLGGYNNKKTYSNEITEIRFDDVLVTGTAPVTTTPIETFYTIVAADAEKPEGNAGSTLFSFTVTRSGDTSEAGVVDYAVTGGTADNGDFAGNLLPTGSISFAANETSRTLNLAISGDSDVETDEAFTVTLSNPSPGSEITVASAEGTITNDDAPPPTTFFGVFADDAVKQEGDSGSTAFTFTVVRSGETSDAASIDYALTGETAETNDFANAETLSGSIAFAVGETSKTLTVEVAGDTDFETDETFLVALLNPPVGSIITTVSAEGTILNDDSNRGATYFFASAYDAVKGEGDSGTTEFTFLVTRSGDTAEADTIDFAVTGSGANPASADDFAGGIFPSGTVTFDVGETSQIVTIQVAGDGDIEPDEGFTFTISNPPSNGQIQTPSDDATIENDDFPAGGPFEIIDADFNGSFAGTEGFAYTPGVFGGTTDPSLTRGSWTSSDVTVVLGGGSGSTPIFDMTGGWERSFTLDQELEVSLSFLYGILHGRNLEADEFTQVLFSIDGGPPQVADQISGDAGSANDYTVAPTTYQTSLGILGPGTHTLVIGGLLNKKDGDDEYSSISIDDVLVTGVVPAAPATSIAIAMDDAVKAEGDAGATAFTFTVTRSGDTTAAGSVDYAISGSDVDGNDFSGSILPSGSFAFAAGETSRTLTVDVAGDADFEDDETFTVSLSNASAGSTITTASADATILNDDAAPPATFFAIAAEDAAKAEGDAGNTAFTFTVTRSGDVGQPGSVDYAVSGNEVDGSDFTGGLLPSGTVDFAAGETSKTLTIDVAGDFAFEGNEAFTVTLSNPSPGNAITTASAEGDILNDDEVIAPPGSPVTLIDENFDETGDSGGFNYEDGSFGGGNPQAYADGGWNAGALSIELGGIDNSTASDMSGGWTKDFFLESESEISLAFLYELIQSEGYESDEVSQVLVSIDGGTPVVVNSLTGNGNGGGDQTTGQQTFSAALGIFAAGGHSLTIGGFNNKKTWGNEASELTIDDVTLVASPTEPPLPVDTTLSIAALDAVQSEGDDDTTLFTFVVSRAGDLISPTSVDYTVSGLGSNGADSSDFLGGLLPSGSVTIDGEGVSAATITIAVAGDVDFESDETFIVTLSNPSPGSAVDTATASGTILNDDTAPDGPMVLVDADFSTTGDTEGFTYSDGTFGGADPQAYANGSWRDEALAIDLGGIDNSDISDMSGGWEVSFSLASEMDVSLSFSYELILAAHYEADEFGQVLYAVDSSPAVIVDQVSGNGNGGSDDTTGTQTFLVDLGTLAAGIHTIALGGLNNLKTLSNESVELTIDDVLITGEPAAPAAASASTLGSLPIIDILPGDQANDILATAGI